MSPENQTHTLTTPITSNPQQAVYMVDDPETKLIAYPHCKFCLISHMRGKLADMDAVKDACDRHCVTLLEDCTHSRAHGPPGEGLRYPRSELKDDQQRQGGVSC